MAAPLAVMTAAYEGRMWLAFSDGGGGIGFLFVFSGVVFPATLWFRAFLTNRFLTFTGTISYGLYLLHKIPDDAFKRLHLKDAHPTAAFWLAVAASYLLAIASWNMLEKPFLKLKRFFQSK